MLPEVVFNSEDPTHNKRLQRLVEKGDLRRIYSGVFTSNLNSPTESIVIRNWQEIVGYLLPGGVVSFRSAAYAGPENGKLYISRGKFRRVVELPGLTVEVIPRPGPIIDSTDGDTPLKKLFLASEARWILENLSAAKGVANRVLSREELEAYLDKILVIRGETGLNRLRDKCRRVAEILVLEREFSRLDKITGALLGTHAKKQLKSRQAVARAAGKPYDPHRLQLFDALFTHLRSGVMPDIEDKASSGTALDNFAFYESYFSNFIEGTTFLVSEAEQIIFEGKLIPNRSEDSHDVIGTFQAASQSPWKDTPAKTEDEFLRWLKSVNALVMKSRSNKQPGEWKEIANQAGNTVFVAPTLVPGTLREGFARIHALDHPLSRALMTMFVVSEVHPFLDGNGRTARIAMNAELTAGKLSRIIIPTIYREDYLLPLKALSNNSDPDPFTRMMVKIQKWTASFNYSQPRTKLTSEISACNAFEENGRLFRLIFPELEP
jgi:hypothetical protein